MGAKQSENMTRALALITRKVNPLSAAEAARQCGIGKSAISKNAVYRQFREEQKQHA